MVAHFVYDGMTPPAAGCSLDFCVSGLSSLTSLAGRLMPMAHTLVLLQLHGFDPDLIPSCFVECWPCCMLITGDWEIKGRCSDFA